MRNPASVVRTLLVLGHTGVLLSVATQPVTVNAQTVTRIEPPGGIQGRIISRDGFPIRRAYAMYAAQGGASDSLGDYVLDGLPTGTLKITFRAVGYDRRDTTVVVRSGERTRLDVVLLSTWRERQDAAIAEAGRAGTVDSIAKGLIRTEKDAGFTYESFGSRLLREAVEQREGKATAIVSPLSGGQALAVALLGANGPTAAGMSTTLSATGLSSDSLAAINARFNDRLKDRVDVTFRVANALWVDPSAKVQPAFAAGIAALYPGAFRATPLYRKEGIDRINHWVDSMTSGKIPIIYTEPLDSLTKLVITNAVYIKAAWLVPFDTAATRDRAFVTAKGARLQVPTMEMTADMSYRRGTGYQAIRLPFRAGLTALYVVLPDSGGSASELLKEFGNTRWPIPDAVKDRREVHLQLPRLHIEDSLDLKGPLTRMGMGLAFDRHRADFNRMFVLDPGENAFIGKAFQRLYLDLDEEGAVAAAVTAIEMGRVTGIIERPPPVEFLVNRPFLFLLRDERSGTSLFVGYVTDPKVTIQ